MEKIFYDKDFDKEFEKKFFTRLKDCIERNNLPLKMVIRNGNHAFFENDNIKYLTINYDKDYRKDRHMARINIYLQSTNRHRVFDILKSKEFEIVSTLNELGCELKWEKDWSRTTSVICTYSYLNSIEQIALKILAFQVIFEPLFKELKK